MGSFDSRRKTAEDAEKCDHGTRRPTTQEHQHRTQLKPNFTSIPGDRSRIVSPNSATLHRQRVPQLLTLIGHIFMITDYFASHKRKRSSPSAECEKSTDPPSKRRKIDSSNRVSSENPPSTESSPSNFPPSAAIPATDVPTRKRPNPKPKRSIGRSSFHVLLPHSDRNTFTRNSVTRSRWPVIRAILSSPDRLGSPTKLLLGLRRLANCSSWIPSPNSSIPSALDTFFSRVLTGPQAQMFFDILLPAMCRCALRIVELFPNPTVSLRVLHKSTSDEISLTREQVCCLMCHGFFCTIPRQTHVDVGSAFHFGDIFAAGSRRRRSRRDHAAAVAHQKLKCFVNYFFEMLVRDADETGSGKEAYELWGRKLAERIVFRRCCLSDVTSSNDSSYEGSGTESEDEEDAPPPPPPLDEEREEEEEGEVNRVRLVAPRWSRLLSRVSQTEVVVFERGNMEDYEGAEGRGTEIPVVSTVDFANRRIGGGVMGHGCVQEEILFLTHPECCVARLFVESLGDHECVVLTGVARYTDHDGYSSEFRFKAASADTQAIPRRRVMEFVVMDAINFSVFPSPFRVQFRRRFLERELNKAFVSFHSASFRTIVTGNWGAGAFRGDHQLKFLIQLMACSALDSAKKMAYYTFRHGALSNGLLTNFLSYARDSELTIGELYMYILRYLDEKNESESLFEFIQRSFSKSLLLPLQRAVPPPPPPTEDLPKESVQ